MQGCKSLIIVIPTLLFAACQHARVDLMPAILPPSQRLQPQPQDRSIVRDKDRVLVHQNFYIFGLFPRRTMYEEQTLCPSRGIREIHQYESMMDAVLAQSTLGIYSPRTLEIKCY